MRAPVNVMEAVVKISGKQHRVTEGQRLEVDRLSAPVGETVTFSEVLLLTGAGNAVVGTPVVDGASVSVRVVAQTRGPKVLVYKYKPKKRYRRTHGSRADLSLLEVTSVQGPGGEKPAKAKAQAEPAKAEASAGDAPEVEEAKEA
jgi:large subunit ribosomal protein L21